jgi:hypothetical protein
MTRAVFEATLMAAQRLDDIGLLISGGEPTDHPDVVEFLQLAKASTAGQYILLLSHGMWLTDPAFDAKKREAILDLVTGVQVTNDPRYYPRRIEQINHPKVVYETQIRQVSPFGRAKTNKIATTRTTPLCFNLRSFARSLQSFPAAIRMQRLRGSFCTPSININGDILAGESVSCCPIGNVTDPLPTLDAGIINLKCNRCGLVDGLSPMHKQAIGEL